MSTEFFDFGGPRCERRSGSALSLAAQFASPVEPATLTVKNHHLVSERPLGRNDVVEFTGAAGVRVE